MRRIAVVNDTHRMSFRSISFMLSDLGYEVFTAGPSFKKVFQVYHGPHLNKWTKGLMELSETPPEAVLVDALWTSVPKIREAGWNGAILVYWLVPAEFDKVRAEFKPQKHLGSLVFRPRLAGLIDEIGVPVDCFWPPYVDWLEQGPRQNWNGKLIFLSKDSGHLAGVQLLKQLTQDPRTNLEVFGGGYPSWSPVISHEEARWRVRRARAYLQLKVVDNAGNAFMEAILQNVPLIIRKEYLESIGFEELFENDRSCYILPKVGLEEIAAASDALKDAKKNQSMALDMKRRLQVASDWKRNRFHFKNLLERIHG